MLEMDFSGIEEKIPQATQVVNDKKASPSTSSKLLKFDLDQLKDASEFKLAICSLIMEKETTYGDIINYFANNKRPVRAAKKLKKGEVLSEVEEAIKRARKGGNVITALKERDTMYDTTAYDLCDFLGYDVILRNRNNPDDERKV